MAWAFRVLGYVCGLSCWALAFVILGLRCHVGGFRSSVLTEVHGLRVFICLQIKTCMIDGIKSHVWLS